MIVAGEASGDRHGASLARALTELYPQTSFDFFGSGGDEMRAAGVETLVDARDVAIIGVPEVARAFGKLYRAYRKLLDAARSRRPAAVVLIDWPDFNMRLARKLHRDGFKTIYYISPQVWAWRRYRVRALRRDVDRMLVILPFETEFYRKAGVIAEYVGHPLAGAVRSTCSREDFCSAHGLDAARPIIALLPGSRHKEVQYHLPVMLDAARRLRSADCGLRIDEPASLPENSRHEFEISNLKSEISNSQESTRNPQSADLQFVVPLASTVARGQVEPAIQQAQLMAPDLVLRVIERDTYNALSYADFAIVASGTATVEAALTGTPMVIIYRGSSLNWRLIRPLIHLDTFGMVNLIAGRRIVPELMQYDATGEKIAAEVSAILSDPARLSQMKDDLGRVREMLASDGVSAPQRAARAVMESLGKL